MTEIDLTEGDVLRAATALVKAFGDTDTAAYFECFAEEASFVFHTEVARLDSRSEYERLWGSWLAEGWRVTECTSRNRAVQLLGAVAVFAHDVQTTTTTGGIVSTTEERETIVFRRIGDDVKAVHEHLSPAPVPPVPAEAPTR